MIGKKIKLPLIAAGIFAIVCLSACGSGSNSFNKLRTAAESKSGIVYRTTYFVRENENLKEEGFPYPVLKDGKYCYMAKDEDGKEVQLTSAVLDDARFSYDVAENIYMAPAESEGKWGYVLLDTTSPDPDNIVWEIDPVYDNAECFSEQFAAVSLEGKYGVINPNNEFIIEPAYDAIKYCSFGIMPAKTGDRWYYINASGENVFGPFEDAESFENGFAAVKKDGKWGYIDKNGIDVTAYVYDDAYSVEYDEENDAFTAWVLQDGKWQNVVIK